MSLQSKRIFAMAMALALLLSACQPAPEKQIIVNKADTVYGQGPTEQTAPQSAALQPYDAPALWQEEYALLQSRNEMPFVSGRKRGSPQLRQKESI